jgi:hypothetical protein
VFESKEPDGYTRTTRGGVAQRLERRTHNPQVGGSNPPAATSLGEPISAEKASKSALFVLDRIRPRKSASYRSSPYFQGLDRGCRGSEALPEQLDATFAAAASAPASNVFELRG